MVVARSEKFCLGPAEIASFLLLVLFKNGGRRVSQGNEEVGVSSRFPCVTPGLL